MQKLLGKLSKSDLTKFKFIPGIKIPTKGEVGWHLPDGWWLFWKARIIEAKFELGRS